LTGLNRQGGRIYEEWLRQLDGLKGRRVFREMADNDAVIGSVLFAVEMLLRNVGWDAVPFSEDPLHVFQAEFATSLFQDMSHTFEDFMSECLTKIAYGFSLFEIVYKRRVGPLERDPTRRSRHTDGRIGIRKLAPRGQETIDEWDFEEEDDGLRGVYQLPPAGSVPTGRGFGRLYIPIEKLLLFRTTSRLGNPEGRSALRTIYVSWWYRKNIQEAEAIGAERDLAGIPKFELPPELFKADASDDIKATMAAWQKVGENLKSDEQAYIAFPLEYDEKGNKTHEVSLMSAAGSRQFNTNEIIMRYSREILQALLADFIMLGSQAHGSFALSSDKTELFATALGAWLKSIAAVLNRHLLTRVWALNGWNPAETPTMTPSDIEKVDIQRWADAVVKMVAAGLIMPGSELDEVKIREMLGLPETGPVMGAPRPQGQPTEEAEPEEEPAL